MNFHGENQMKTWITHSMKLYLSGLVMLQYLDMEKA